MSENIINIEKTVPIGSLLEWFSETIPKGWLLLDGSAISRNEYSELFDLYGVKYGEGDGTTTFNLPNIKGKTLVGLDVTQNEFNTLGKVGGEKFHVLTVGEMPSHGHSLATAGYSGNISAVNRIAASIDYDQGKVGKNGGDQPHNNLQPYITVNFIVKAKQEIEVISLPEQKEYTSAILKCTKLNSQTIGANYQLLSFDNASGNLDKLKLENNKVLVNYDAKTLSISTMITTDSLAPGIIKLKLFRERDNQKTELQEITKSRLFEVEHTFMIDVQKNDIISLEIAYDKQLEANKDGQTYLDVIAYQ